MMFSEQISEDVRSLQVTHTGRQGSIHAPPESKTNVRKPQQTVCSAQRGAAMQHGCVCSLWSPSWS